MRKNYFVARRNSDGDFTKSPLKTWLRANPTEVPQDHDPNESTSRQLAYALKRGGWGKLETETEVYLVKQWCD
jgi:hypothetical protein